MNSRRLRAVSPLIILAVLSLQSCHGDDVHGRDVSKNETDEGGIFGFSFSPLSYLFGSDHGDGADEEKEIVDDVTTMETAAQAGVEIDNADNQGDDKGVTNDMETAEQAHEAAEKIKEAGDDVSGTDRSAGDVRDLDEEPASAADKGQPSMSADQDEVKSEIERLKEDAELAEFIDEKHEAQPRDWHRKLSSAAKNTGLSKQMAASAPYNITSSAVSDASSCQQSPNMDDLSRYMRTCQNCLVQWDRYQCPLHEKVLELEKWMRELQDLLSYGCRMDDNCRGTDKCCHSRDPALERALDQMTQLARDMYNVFLESCSSCPRDGGWSDWCEWSACSVSCGEGTRTRSRACNNPAPKGNGRQCQGPPMDTTPCFGPPCCTDGSWSPWSPFGPCQATCGQGMQERTRTCSNPPPSSCGRTCPGPSSDMRLCDTEVPCCVHGNWAEWSLWSSCPVTCGRGTVGRVRTCSSPAPNYCGQTCVGPSRDTRPCAADDCCVDGNWDTWGSWGTCSASCGQGTRARQRRCSSPAPNYCGKQCPGDSVQRGDCPDLPVCEPICVDGEWGPWQPWSECSATCDRGMQSRMRRCDNPPPNFCGRRCPGLSFETNVCVSDRTCCVDGNWGTWESWGTCSASCGQGTRARQRRCSSPAPNYCGKQCPGDSVQRGDCPDLPVCEPECVDGEWAEWSPWSPCPVTCGRGTVDRVRTCSNPAPSDCGRSCPGPSRDTRVCDLDDCCVHGNWGLWSMWSACPVSCGLGQRERRRLCNSPPPNDCGQTCPGESTERTQQRCGPDQVSGNWGVWGAWSACPVSCGLGQRERRRLCDSPPPNICGETCLGQSLERVQQPCGPDQVDGSWGPWEPWSTCSVTCGRGQELRRRTCDNPPANQCGRPCPGSDADRRDCNPGPCCVDGNWGLWERWGACSVTCDQGVRDRRRSCDNPTPNFCGQSCPGLATDRVTCDTGVPCRSCEDGNWGLWSAWSACTVTCGMGQVERRRRCDSPPPNDCGRSCPGPAIERDLHNCGSDPVDGNWGPWQPWSTCSVTCGIGQQLRRRRCDNPAANLCGRPCLGFDSDSKSCDPGPCCVNGNWGVWGAWSACPVSCGLGQRERRRLCDSPPPNDCGQTCLGQSLERVQQPCGPDQVDGSWGPWEPWSTCSVTCGRGQELRRRTCDNPPANQCGRPCPGSDADRRDCNPGPCCVDGNWGLWERWGACSVTCDQGVRDRRRSCDNPTPNFCGQSCPGLATDRVTCDTGVPCRSCEDGNWGLWSAWSACTVTCGMGQVERRRRCDSPPPNDCGRSCPGPATERDLHRCGSDPVDGNWGPWQPWSTCSVTCGIGQQLRRRRCDNPAANLCGRPCLGFDSDSKSCDPRPCCADRQWSLWSPWSTCSATCGTGTRRRERFCQSVGFGQACDITCPGSGFETTGCVGLQPCELPWGPWSPCSATCEGQGIRERRRQYAGVPGVLGVTSVETEPCRVFSPRCSEWGPWENWCPCDCQKGITSRRRNCVERMPSGQVVTVDAQQCAAGESREEKYCDVRKVCPVCVMNCDNRRDGNYSSCTSCRDYVNCKNGQMSILSCTVQHYEWDAFIAKCRQGGSPSCSLQPCVTSCTGRDDGPVPGCSGCSTYLQCRGGRDTEYQCPAGQEFNAHSERCEVDMSPTCTRATIRSPAFMMGDAPADSYFDMEDEDAEERYQQLVKQTGVAAILHRDNHTVTLFKSQADGDKRDDKVDNYIKIIGDGRDKEKAKPSPRMSKKDKKEVTCQTDCTGLVPGLYQSCLGCDQYLVCTRHGATRFGRCPRNKRWDDKHKKCRKHSLTCNSTPGSKPNPGKS